jgi:hypothetical protein
MIGWLKAFFSRFRSNTLQIPTGLPAPINDNQYLAASANAGMLDRATGAYDKYLFEDKEIPEMPYEAAVDNHLELMSSRLNQRFRRFISRAHQHEIRAKGRVERITLKIQKTHLVKEELQEQLARQVQILNGNSLGKNGLNWQGEEPILLGAVSTMVRLYSRYFVFVLVALVDAFIIWSSFISINIRAFEAMALTVPAVAAQVVFPHIAGARLRLVVRGMHKKLSVWLEVIATLAVWLTFVYVISRVRVIYIKTLLEQSGESWNDNLDLIFTLLSVILITALGAWLLFSAVRENPHEDEALKVKVRIAKFERTAVRQAKRKSRFQEKLELAQEAAGALNSELQTAVESSRLELAEAAKSVYRRALINEMGDPEFTKSYYQDESK